MVRNDFSPTIHLYDGMVYTLPAMPDEREIVGYKKAIKDQKFERRKPLHPKEFDKLSKESKLDYLSQEYLWRTQGRWYFISGVPVYFTGDYDFFLNYWFMGADTEDGYPEYRWAQCRWHYFLDFCDKDDNCYGGIMLCQKRFSKTEAGLSHLYNHASTVGRNDNFGMMSTDGKTAKENLMRDRVIRSHKNIFKYLQPKTHEQGTSKDITVIKFVSTSDETGEQSDALNNNVFYKPTKVDAFQGHRMREIFVDEPGSIDEIDFGVAYRTFKQQLVLGKKIYGKIYLPTTLETLSPRSAPAYKKLFFDSNYNDKDANGRTKSGLYRYFKPYWEGMEGFIDEYGNDMVDECKEFIENQYNAADDDGRRQLRRQYPPTVEAAFDEVVGSALEEDVITLLKNRRDQLKGMMSDSIAGSENKIAVFCVKLYEDGDGCGFKPIEKKEGEMMIYEHVKPNVKYKIGIDSTNTDNTTGSAGGSKFAFTILKGYEGVNVDNYTVVADFSRRPDRMEDCLQILYLACKMYNKYDGLVGGVLPERNVAGASFVGTYLRQKGMERVLMMDKTTGYFGLYRTGHVKETQIIKGNLFLRKYGHIIKSLNLVESLLLLGKENTDLADAFLTGIMALGDFDKQEGNKPVQIVKKKMKITIKNGKRVTEWVNITLDAAGNEIENDGLGKNNKYSYQMIIPH